MQVSAIVVARPLVACSRKGLKKRRMLQSINLWAQRAGMIFVGKNTFTIISRIAKKSVGNSDWYNKHDNNKWQVNRNW